MSQLLTKLKTTPQGWHTSSKERKSYYLYFAGQNAIYNLVAGFLTSYLLFLGVDPTKSGTVMLIIKIWDAVNDAIFGVIFDSVKFKSGKKYLPWLKISTALTPIATILMFIIPKTGGENLKIAWFAIAYIIWDTVYTLCDVPIYGVITSMTENLDERNTMLSYKSIWGGVGSGFTTVVATLLVGEFIKSNYTVVAVLVAIFAAATMVPTLFHVKERFKPEEEESFTIRRMLSYLIRNKYLLIYYFGYFFYSAANVTNALNTFASYYLFHNSQFALVVGAVNMVPSLLISLVVPQFTRRMDKMKLYLICCFIFVAASTATWAFGYNSMVLYLALTTVRSIPLSIIGVLMFMFTPDCAEYGKYTTGIDAKGITFAIQTFMVKLTAAVSNSLVLFLLGLKWSEWKTYAAENFDELNQIGATQTPHALNFLWFIYVMIPAIGCLMAALVWLFYKLNDRDVQIMTNCNAGKITRTEAENMLSRKY